MACASLLLLLDDTSPIYYASGVVPLSGVSGVSGVSGSVGSSWLLSLPMEAMLRLVRVRSAFT